jgi:hypothetical protein
VTEEFLAYLVVTGVITVFAAMIMGLRRVRNPRRMAGWFLLAFVVTYALRPLGTQVVTRDRFLYTWLGIVSIEDYWLPMTASVGLSLLFLAVGYRWAGGRTRGKIPETILSERTVTPVAGVIIGSLLVLWGYASIFISRSVGGGFIRPEGLQFGIASGTTAWLLESDLFVASGALVLYATTGRLIPSLGTAAPWMAIRALSGWGRVNILAFLLALVCLRLLYVGRSGAATRVVHRVQLLALGVALAGTLLIFFPAARTSRDFFARGDLSSRIRDAFQTNFAPETWLSTTSDIQGYETTLYHLQKDRKPAFGTYYIYYYFLQPIPRLIWPDKPLPTTLAQQWLGISPDLKLIELGLAPGAVGMAFQQWGWLGIPAEFLFTGWFFRRAESWAFQRRRVAYARIAYAGLFSLLPQMTRDGLLYMLANRWLLLYAPPVVLLFLISRTRRQRLINHGEVEGLPASSRRARLATRR